MAWDVEELTQEVLVLLFANEAQVLMRWNPERGLSLENYVGLVAERFAARALERRCVIVERLPSSECDDVVDSRPGPEAALAMRQFVGLILEGVQGELSARGTVLFKLLFVEDRSIEEVSSQTGLSRDATYAWRSRLVKRARRVARQMDDPESPPEDASGPEGALDGRT